MFGCVGILKVEKPKVVGVSSALDLTAYWLPTSCLWLVAELWSSKQLEVKVKESCQMFWQPWTICWGRASDFTQRGTMWNSAGTDLQGSLLNHQQEVIQQTGNSIWLSAKALVGKMAGSERGGRWNRGSLGNAAKRKRGKLPGSTADCLEAGWSMAVKSRHV